MTTLADEILRLTDPTPKFIDPEDDVNAETAANLADAPNEETVVPFKISNLRSKTAPLLEDVDVRYAGIRVSRKSFENFDKKDAHISGSSEDEDLSNDQVDDDDDDDDDDLSEEDLKTFKKQIENKFNRKEQAPGSDEESEGESEIDEKEDGIDMVKHYSNIDVASEIEKGKAVQSQLELWDRLCELRIKLQKILHIANKLPQHNTWEHFQDTGGKEFLNNVNKGNIGMKNILDNLIYLQTELLLRNPETRAVESGSVSDVIKSDKITSDDEVLSDTDEEDKKMKRPETIQERNPIKRKRRIDNYEELMQKRHKLLIPYRNTVIQKWDEKTRLSTGKIAHKSFLAFENSAVKQIEQVLQDETRLIKRTQLKRTHYRVLGKPLVYEIEDTENGDENVNKSKQDLLLRDYDTEIFDDDDFYHQILKDIMAWKSVGIDPSILIRQKEILKIRRKLKKKVDMKASKGRKIRYDVHPKLVNFMAPENVITMSDQAIDNLNTALFGKGERFT